MAHSHDNSDSAAHLARRAITARSRATTISPASSWSSATSPTRRAFTWKSCAITSSSCTAGAWSAGSKSSRTTTTACRDRFVCIEPGSAVDCCGHDIIVARRRMHRHHAVAGHQGSFEENDDTDPHRLQICVRFRECPTEEFPCSTMTAAATTPNARPIAFWSLMKLTS